MKNKIPTMGFVLAIAIMATAGAMFANTSQLAHS
jgi:hypothetical protein